ncbi:uncharacterized protein MYCFIDRAFT_175635 [Pseudocercospora fijiensis CIRAD86]|uniref:Uncharacterized protein n=1 Tax=Pseudocercospora fijiensis (strain CIRAD86) TaxID=383855 RepID=M2ZST7_PSEFD|nr:uncharacterized protein MYCFIDRAFT_175635 [Pseudocercospora fijiensis CIRAD86]EME82079.1 hypothetical protein MYCFIDRAFT_175635 [Pseudocercospora fijiensis CIRAD86]
MTRRCMHRHGLTLYICRFKTLTQSSKCTAAMFVDSCQHDSTLCETYLTTLLHPDHFTLHLVSQDGEGITIAAVKAFVDKRSVVLPIQFCYHGQRLGPSVGKPTHCRQPIRPSTLRPHPQRNLSRIRKLHKHTNTSPTPHHICEKKNNSWQPNPIPPSHLTKIRVHNPHFSSPPPNLSHHITITMKSSTLLQTTLLSAATLTLAQTQTQTQSQHPEGCHPYTCQPFTHAWNPPPTDYPWTSYESYLRKPSSSTVQTATTRDDSRFGLPEEKKKRDVKGQQQVLVDEDFFDELVRQEGGEMGKVYQDPCDLGHLSFLLIDLATMTIPDGSLQGSMAGDSDEALAEEVTDLGSSQEGSGSKRDCSTNRL